MPTQCWPPSDDIEGPVGQPGHPARGLKTGPARQIAAPHQPLKVKELLSGPVSRGLGSENLPLGDLSLDSARRQSPGGAENAPHNDPGWSRTPFISCLFGKATQVSMAGPPRELLVHGWTQGEQGKAGTWAYHFLSGPQFLHLRPIHLLGAATLSQQ